jgi:uncharacterized lipoprotein
MKLINATIVSAVCLTLGACSVSITDDGVKRDYRDYEKDDRITVTLPNGDRDNFSCPAGTTSFVLNRKDEGMGMAYGCRTNGAPMPTLGDGN